MPTSGDARSTPKDGSEEGVRLPLPGHSPPSREQGVNQKSLQLILAVHPPLWAELLTRALTQEAAFSLLVAVSDEEQLAGSAKSNPAAVILFDYEAMGPGSEGIIARIRRLAPATRILVLARRSGEEVATAVLRAGAMGIVGKQSNLATLLTAIQAVGAGEVWAPRQVTARVIHRLASPPQVGQGESVDLTRREWEVVDAIGRGESNKEIALALGISEKTVKTHMSNIFLKTSMHNRYAVALWAQQGLHQKS